MDMVDMTFVQDFQTGKWIRCYDEKLCNEDVKNLDYAIIVCYNNDYEVCINGKNEGVYNDISYLKKFYGLFARFKYPGCTWNYSEQKLLILFRWKLRKRDEYNHILLAVDYMVVLECPAWGGGWGRIEYCHECFLSYSVDMKKSLIRLSNKNYKNHGHVVIDLISIPDNIAAELCTVMQDEAGKAFGIRPTVNMTPHGLDFIEKFVSRPFDVNITYWQDILGKEEYEKHFPREQMDNYRPLCQYLGIVKPPKSLRKAYGENPYAPMIYLLMQELGVQDLNFIRKFFEFDRELFWCRLHGFRFDSENGKFTTKISDDYHLWRNVDEFSHFVKARKSEKYLVKLLYRMAQASSDTWRRYIADTLDMFSAHANELSDDALKLLAEKGPTKTVHDLLSMELRCMDEENVVVEYEDNIASLECMLDDYEFHLVHETKELQEIGIKLYNCVETYRDKVLNGTSIICYVKCKNEHQACIEIKNQDTVVQAYAYNNQHMTGELLKHVLYWMRLKKLRLDVEYMAGVDISDANYQEKELLHKHISVVNFDELMSIDEEDTPSGWYTRFEELLPQQRAYHLAPPPWIQIDSEQEYLAYALPEGDRLVKAAQQANPEAMTVLGNMYLQGNILKQDCEKARYWFLKAAKEQHYDRAWKCLLQLPQNWRANNKDEDEGLAIGLAYLRTYGRVM